MEGICLYLRYVGSRHRQQRKMLNPVFSISHMRHMTPIFYTVVHKVRHKLSFHHVTL